MTQYHVTLNGQGYVLDLSRYQKRPRAPFIGRVGSGAVSIDQLQGPEQLLRLTDWSGGEGQVQHDSAAPSRYRTGGGADGFSYPGALQLGPQAVQIGGATTENYLGPGVVWGGSLYVGSGSGLVYVWNGSTLTAAFNAGATSILAMEVFENRLYFGHSIGGALGKWDGAAITYPVTAGGPIYTLRTHYRQAAQYLYVGSQQAGINNVGRIYYFDGSALSLAQYDPEEFRPAASFVLGQRCYFAATNYTGIVWGLYSVDDQTSGGVWRAHVRSIPGSPAAAVVADGVAYISDAYSGRIWAWDGSSLRVVRELARVGAAYAGALTGMAAWRGALWLGVAEGGGVCSLLRYAPSLGSSGASSGQAAWSRPVTGLVGTDVSSLSVFQDELVVGMATPGASRFYRVRSSVYGASGQVVTGLVDCGLPGTSKLLRSVTIVTSALVSPQSVQVEYQLEDTGAWVSLGTLSSVGATTATWSFPAATACRQVAFRVTLAGTAGATSSPVLYELVLRYVPRPAVTREWELAVLLEGTPELPLVTLDSAPEPLTGAQLTSALWTAAGATGTVSFVDLDGTSYQVYVDDLREEVGKISQRRGYQRVGLVRLVEAA